MPDRSIIEAKTTSNCQSNLVFTVKFVLSVSVSDGIQPGAGELPHRRGQGPHPGRGEDGAADGRDRGQAVRGQGPGGGPGGALDRPGPGSRGRRQAQGWRGQGQDRGEQGPDEQLPRREVGDDEAEFLRDCGGGEAEGPGLRERTLCGHTGPVFSRGSNFLYSLYSNAAKKIILFPPAHGRTGTGK